MQISLWPPLLSVSFKRISWRLMVQGFVGHGFPQPMSWIFYPIVKYSHTIQEIRFRILWVIYCGQIQLALFVKRLVLCSPWRFGMSMMSLVTHGADGTSNSDRESCAPCPKMVTLPQFEFAVAIYNIMIALERSPIRHYLCPPWQCLQQQLEPGGVGWPGTGWLQ